MRSQRNSPLETFCKKKKKMNLPFFTTNYERKLHTHHHPVIANYDKYIRTQRSDFFARVDPRSIGTYTS